MADLAGSADFSIKHRTMHACWFRRRVTLWLVCQLFLPWATVNAQVVRSDIGGTVRNSKNMQPLSAAAIALRSGDFHRETRTDQSGKFRLTLVPPGVYRMSVRRIGYTDFSRELRVGAADTAIVIALTPLPQRLGAVRVRENVTGIFGVVGSAAGLRPIAGATISVAGSGGTVTTDSAGAFVVELGKPGVYVVRMTHPGFAPAMMSLDVPRNRMIEASRLLDSSSTALSAGFEGLWADFDQRLRWRSPMNSAVVPRQELVEYGGSLTDALQGSRSMVLSGLRIGGPVCLFVNGIPKPGWPIDAIRVEEIEAVEVYGGGGDLVGSLGRRWPSGAACTSTGRSTTRRPGATPEYAHFVSVWLKP